MLDIIMHWSSKRFKFILMFLFIKYFFPIVHNIFMDSWLKNHSNIALLRPQHHCFTEALGDLIIALQEICRNSRSFIDPTIFVCRVIWIVTMISSFLSNSIRCLLGDPDGSLSEVDAAANRRYGSPFSPSRIWFWWPSYPPCVSIVHKSDVRVESRSCV